MQLSELCQVIKVIQADFDSASIVKFDVKPFTRHEDIDDLAEDRYRYRYRYRYSMA